MTAASTHETWVEPVSAGLGWRAKCSCGWHREARAYRDAERDATFHAELKGLGW